MRCYAKATGEATDLVYYTPMAAIRRRIVLCSLGGLAFLAASCGSTKRVSINDVHVTPVTSADVQKAIHDPGAKAVLVNVWATWCGPCREEFPGLVRVAQKYNRQGLKTILVSADDTDQVTAVKKFLADEGVDFPAYLKAEKDQAFIDGMGKQWSGALPATFIFDGNGKLHDFWEGGVTFNVFEQKVVEALGKQSNPTGGSS
ncbi:MAG TPA: TlpA disulfide reductase family protein [Verrucomicrobiae bacterium]|nr:TlpA disulfide reductase family protein [Verrucomicrobiae bacterium]